MTHPRSQTASLSGRRCARTRVLSSQFDNWPLLILQTRTWSSSRDGNFSRLPREWAPGSRLESRPLILSNAKVSSHSLSIARTQRSQGSTLFPSFLSLKCLRDLPTCLFYSYHLFSHLKSNEEKATEPWHTQNPFLPLLWESGNPFSLGSFVWFSHLITKGKNKTS